jgi:hypothetical protein
MNDFEKKVRAAAVAGWWTVLIAVLFVTLQWIIYLVVMSDRPAWLLSMWGPGTEGRKSSSADSNSVSPVPRTKCRFSAS